MYTLNQVSKESVDFIDFSDIDIHVAISHLAFITTCHNYGIYQNLQDYNL